MDYILRITGRSDLRNAEATVLPVGRQTHPLESALLLRTLRLNCQTAAYGDLWAELFDVASLGEDWAVECDLPPLNRIDRKWTRHTPLRVERERRAALVETDALVAVWLGIGIEELLAILRARYPILVDRERDMWFDSSGRRIAADPYAFGFGQTKEHYEQLTAHLGNPKRTSEPSGYKAPFYKADRENEYRQAHAVFSKRLRKALARDGRHGH